MLHKCVVKTNIGTITVITLEFTKPKGRKGGFSLAILECLLKQKRARTLTGCVRLVRGTMLLKASQWHVSQVSENIWKVTSQYQDDTVHRLLTTCECKLSSSSCNVCVHQYTCSCLDATIHATVRKHIHHSHEVNKHCDKNHQKWRQPDHKNKQWNGEVLHWYSPSTASWVQTQCVTRTVSCRLLLRNALIH